MIIGIIIAVFVIGIVVAYVVGHVNGVSEVLDYGGRGCDFRDYYCCDHNRCFGKVCLFPRELELREEQAYMRRKYEAEKFQMDIEMRQRHEENLRRLKNIN